MPLRDKETRRAYLKRRYDLHKTELVARITRIEVICLMCDQPFMKSAVEAKRKPRHFCSHSCLAVFNNMKRARHESFADPMGYVHIWKSDHPSASQYGYVLEHRIVMETYLGRYLTRNEVVHHINGKKGNNSLSNLRLMTSSEHARFHAKMGDTFNLRTQVREEMEALV